MKKLAALVLIGLLVIPIVSLAVNPSEIIPPSRFTSLDSFVKFMDEAANWVFFGLLALATIFLVVSGYLFVTAGGSSEKVTSARKMLTNALIGLAVGFGAKGLVSIVRVLISGTQ